MERRFIGVVVLVTALLLTVAVPRLMHPPLGAAGSPLPLPTAPTVGSCLDGTTVVPCHRPHDAEVTAAWDPDAPGLTRAVTSSVCRARGFDYVGVTVLGKERVWVPQMDAISSVVEAPPWQRVGTRGWSICTIAPSSGREYVGSVRSLDRSPWERPPSFGLCADATDTIVDCRLPHTTEFLSEQIGLAPSSLSQPVSGDWWSMSCRSFASRLLLLPDPTFAAQIDIEVISRRASPEFGRPSNISFASCVAVAVGGAELTDSIVGLGDAPLPFN